MGYIDRSGIAVLHGNSIFNLLFFSCHLHLWVIGEPTAGSNPHSQCEFPSPAALLWARPASGGPSGERSPSWVALLPGMFFLTESWLYSHGLPSIFAPPSGAPQTMALLQLLQDWNPVCSAALSTPTRGPETRRGGDEAVP